jgi:RNA polymerase sigma-70 factor, ECF subfamily
MSNNMKDEQALLKGARGFDENTLAEIYDRYSPGLYRYAMRLTGDTDRSEDCVAETFSRLLTALKNGGGPQQHLQAYLYRIAHNWITDCYRREPFIVTSIEDEPVVDELPDPAQEAATRLNQESVRQALHRLTTEQRQVIALKYLEGWRNEEIAQALGKPVGAVKALQFRGLQALRRLFEQENEVEER